MTENLNPIVETNRSDLTKVLDYCSTQKRMEAERIKNALHELPHSEDGGRREQTLSEKLETALSDAEVMQELSLRIATGTVADMSIAGALARMIDGFQLVTTES